MKFSTCTLLLSLTLTLPAFSQAPKPEDDSKVPLVPGTPWKVHDMNRPKPPVVKPGAQAGQAPADAIILFNGTDTSALQTKAKDEKGKRTGAWEACHWQVENGELLIADGDCWTKENFQSCQLHLEWKVAPNTEGSAQKRGNSGIFFMDLFETQILDDHENPTYADGMTGAVYGQHPPLVNATRPPGEWQTYDVLFEAPTFEGEKMLKPAHITTFINGICVQHHTTILGPTRHKDIGSYIPAQGPIRIQDHRNKPPVRMRNLWIRKLP
jgi:Domain of Unknown Function (DUF1080)